MNQERIAIGGAVIDAEGGGDAAETAVFEADGEHADAVAALHEAQEGGVLHELTQLERARASARRVPKAQVLEVVLLADFKVF